jgi:PAS domain S-box-containing protein
LAAKGLPSPPTAPPPRDRLRIRIFLALAAVFAVLVAASATALTYRHNEAIRVAQQRADNLALILSEHFRRTVDAIDATLKQLALHSQRAGGAKAPAESWAPVLAAALSGLPGVGSLTVIDASGTITASTIPAIVGRSRADQFLFRQLSSTGDNGLVADEPFKALSDGRMLIPLGRRLSSADGSFDGIVVATLEPNGLRGFYRSVSVGPNGIILVLHPAGLVLFREPSRGNPIGEPAGDNPLFRAQRAQSGSGILRGPLEPGGASYVSAYRSLSAPPVIIAVALAESDVLAMWRSQVVIVSSVTGAMGLALLIAALFIGREIRARVSADLRLIEANATLLDSERMARAIIETALDAFVQMDQAGTIVEWTRQAEALFLWTREEALGKSLAELIVPDAYRAHYWDGLARFLRTGETTQLGRRFEIDARRKDGREIKVELAITALRRSGGYVFNSFIRDLTDKVAAEQQLRQSQKMEAVGQLTGGVAHDFNNILTVITGTIELLEEGVADRPQLLAVARMIDEAATRGAELTNRLLAFARRQPLQPRPTDVNALVLEVDSLLRPTLGEAVEIVTKLDERVSPALVDPSQLTTALLNLAINARDAMPGGGKLTLETADVILDETYAEHADDVTPGPYTMIAVSDTGSGIPPDLIDHVFEPFFTTKGVGRGTGLGLAMVYGFAKQSNGHIKVYSEVGNGTTMRIYLPRAAATIGERPKHAQPEPVTGGDERILVVEDDALVRSQVTAQLQSLGYTIRTVPDGIEALAVLESDRPFDLLFTDVILPRGMNGRELADEALKRRPTLKVLYTSGYSENAVVHHGRLDPGVLLLTKPYRKEDLARMIRRALDADVATPQPAVRTGRL